MEQIMVKLYLFGAGFSCIPVNTCRIFNLAILSPTKPEAQNTKVAEITPFHLHFFCPFLFWLVNTAAPNSSFFCSYHKVFTQIHYNLSHAFYFANTAFYIKQKDVSLFGNAVAASRNSETKGISTPYRNRVSPSSLVPSFTLPHLTKKVGEEIICRNNLHSLSHTPQQRISYWGINYYGFSPPF